MATDTHLYKQIKNSIYIYIGEIKFFFQFCKLCSLSWEYVSLEFFVLYEKMFKVRRVSYNLLSYKNNKNKITITIIFTNLVIKTDLTVITGDQIQLQWVLLTNTYNELDNNLNSNLWLERWEEDSSPSLLDFKIV